MKICSIVLGEFAVDDFAMRNVLMKELRLAIVDGGFDRFIVSHGRIYDGIALGCLQEIQKEYPHIEIAVAMPMKSYAYLNTDTAFGEYLRKYYTNIETFTFDTSHVNHKFQLLEHYLQMAKLSSFMLFMLQPTDNSSPEYFAWKEASSQYGVDVYNIYNSVNKQPQSLDGLFAYISNKKLIERRQNQQNQ